ncbi:DUF1294 domain-containing protein [Vibrio sinaloensis]|nr:DUF1294 domain-containing protein [Vibrio sinaloensis]
MPSTDRCTTMVVFKSRTRFFYLLNMFGGWPGALFAQSILHHKYTDLDFKLFVLAFDGFERGLFIAGR